MNNNQLEWFSGPPPAIGWWPIGLDTYRWWNGVDRWSSAANREMSADDAAHEAGWLFRVDLMPIPVKWRHWSVEIDGTDGVGAHE